MTALPIRTLASLTGSSASPEEEKGFGVHRRLARLAAAAPIAGVYVVHDGDAGEAVRATCEGLGSGDHSRAALLARRVMLAAEPVVLAAPDEGESGPEEERIAAFLGIPLGSSSTRFRGSLCVIDRVAREWTREQIRAVRDVALLLERELSRRPAAEERYALETVVRMLAKAVDNMQLGVTITDLDGSIVYTNPAEARMHGYTVEDLLGQHARMLGPPDQVRRLPPLDRNMPASWTRETVNVRRDGSRFPVLLWSDLVTDASGTPVGMVTCSEDMTERKRSETALREVAMRDPLTGLPNRAWFQERLVSAIERQRSDPTRRFAVLFLDLDRFKVVNDSLGHHVGDDLLRVVATRLQGCVRPPDTVARFGGDEFAVLLEDVGTGEPALRIADRILASIAAPVPLEGYDLATSASVGIVQSAAHMGQPDYIWQAADMAMYRAKMKGPGRYEVFDRAMHLQAMARLKTEIDLRRAVERGEFRLDYQPVVDVALGRTVGFEALLRWEHPERGEVQPAAFIEVAEETGLIVPLGEWVLREACREARGWQPPAGGAPVWVGVNLSPRQLAQPALADGVRRALKEAGFAADLLRLEITEAAVIDGKSLAADGLRRLKEAGVQLILDDFGTGYSSISHLHRLPIDAVKIDRSFLREMQAGDRHARLVEGVIRLARGADLRVIAEGVADAAQLAVLASLGCDMVQGYHLAPPLAAGRIAGFLRQEAASHPE